MKTLKKSSPDKNQTMSRFKGALKLFWRQCFLQQALLKFGIKYNCDNKNIKMK